MFSLVLLRHGESIWNKENLFTGWTDIGLSADGTEEAIIAGRILKREGYVFDAAYTSVLKRAIITLYHVLSETDLLWIPVIKVWQLNERHYGALQGKNKAAAAKEFGEEQVMIWRRSYTARPPAVTPDDERFPGNDPRYRDIDEADLPCSESLEDTVERIIPFWRKTILPEVQAGKRILISAHGNSLRGLVKHLEGIGDREIASLEIPTGIPLVFELDNDLRPVHKFYLEK